MSCAISARYSSDLQRPTSIEDQVRRCTEFAAKQGWTVVEESIRFDEARSAATVAGRDALHALMVAAKTKPRPFDCLLVDDTSRLARYLPDVVSMHDILLDHGVFIYAVSQRLDCREKASGPLLTLPGMTGWAIPRHPRWKGKPWSGGAGVERDAPWRRSFRVSEQPIENPTRTGKYGRAAVSGVKPEFDKVEAPIVERVFTMYAKCNRPASIAKILIAEGVQAPQPALPGRCAHGARPPSGRCCATNATGESLYGTEPRRSAIPRLAEKPAGRALSPTGCGWKFPNGESSPGALGTGGSADSKGGPEMVGHQHRRAGPQGPRSQTPV
jgi:hypothetical protein